VSGSDAKQTSTRRLRRWERGWHHTARIRRRRRGGLFPRRSGLRTPSAKARYQDSVITRAEMLAELMRLKRSVAVAGAHGKPRPPRWCRGAGGTLNLIQSSSSAAGCRLRHERPAGTAPSRRRGRRERRSRTYFHNSRDKHRR
jgi:hypothetical protein